VPPGLPVSIRIGGTVYKVQSSASVEDVERLARQVDERLSQLSAPGRPPTPQSFLLVAMSFAHEADEARSALEAAESRARLELERERAAHREELERERRRRLSLEAETKELLHRVVDRIDDVLESERGSG
jgi:hypothetical protein